MIPRVAHGLLALGASRRCMPIEPRCFVAVRRKSTGSLSASELLLSASTAVRRTGSAKRSALSKVQLIANPTDISGEDASSLSIETSSKPIRGARGIIELYQDFQARFPGHFVLMQVGDFYEIYGEDAVAAARLLEIGISAPRKDKPSMTGVPVRYAEPHLEKFIKAGHRVVLCDQFCIQEGRNKFDRRVARIITPGTITEEGLLDRAQNNFLLAIEYLSDDKLGFAWIDISTGYFAVSSSNSAELARDLIRINPSEVVVHPSLDISRVKKVLPNAYIQASTTAMTPDASVKLLQDLFSRQNDNAIEQCYAAIGNFADPELSACGILLDYIFRTQVDKRPYIEIPTRIVHSKTMSIDPQSFRSLEVLKNATTGTVTNSLFHVLDCAKTGPGSRLLARRLCKSDPFVFAVVHLSCLVTPSTDLDEIDTRLDLVQAFFDRPDLLVKIRQCLDGCQDLERCYQRLSMNRAGGPRDMQSVVNTLQRSAELREIHGDLKGPAVLRALLEQIPDFAELTAELASALEATVPQRLGEGRVIRSGYSEKLDLLRGSLSGFSQFKDRLEGKYRKMTGINRLSVTENKRLGWMIEVPKSERQLLEAGFYLDSQTETKYRYKTEELNSLQLDQSADYDNTVKLEAEIYEELRQRVVSFGAGILRTSRAMAEIDVASSNAWLAREKKYTRPIVTSEQQFRIIGGRHPVVEHLQMNSSRVFVRNDCDLGSELRFVLVTGPNMGGKSTFLRQNALIAVMAQAGCFVPAEHATIGIVDAIFTRIGAADDLSRDRSTFMVEMLETANILKSATLRSLVIMDEIGRGTAAEEGFALAWGIAEHLYAVNCSRCIFATHYFELDKLVSTFESAQTLKTTAIEDDQGNVIFIHKLVPGVARHSHALSIARLAGLPAAALDSAHQRFRKITPTTPQISHVSNNHHVVERLERDLANVSDKVRRASETMCHLEDVTPKQSLDLLYKIRDMLI